MLLQANGLSIEVDDQGAASAPPILMIMGLGMQLIAWPDPLVQRLVDRGHRVVRFDNRDAGLSQGFDHLGTPNLAWAALRFALRLPVRSAYSVADMAEDARGVLDALGIARAHVVGASMGGMIAQHLAARHPQRVSKLTLMMTTSGARHLPQARSDVRMAMLERRPIDPNDIEALVDRSERLFTLIGSPGYRPKLGPETEAFRERLRRSVKRAYRPGGIVRQLVAIAADGDRSTLLSRIQAPTHIVHGAQDPLVPASAAYDLLAKIPGATIEVIPGMGHDLPPALWPRLADAILGPHQPPANAR